MNFMQEKIKNLDVIDADQLVTLMKKNKKIMIHYYLFFNSLSIRFKTEEDKEYKIYHDFYEKYRLNNSNVSMRIKDYRLPLK